MLVAMRESAGIRQSRKYKKIARPQTGDSPMAKAKNGVNKSEEVRRLLKANPKTTASEVVANLEQKGIKISSNLFYFVKGQIKGRKGRKKKAHQMVAKVTAATGSVNGDAVSAIRNIKALAGQVGGLKNLKALVDALSE